MQKAGDSLVEVTLFCLIFDRRIHTPNWHESVFHEGFKKLSLEPYLDGFYRCFSVT